MYQKFPLSWYYNNRLKSIFRGESDVYYVYQPPVAIEEARIFHTGPVEIQTRKVTI